MTIATKPAYRVGVLGLGREGLDVLEFLNAAGLRPIGLDSKPISDIEPKLLRRFKRLTSELFLGKTYLDQVGELDILFRSPGVPLDLPQLKKARRRGVVMSSLTQIFFELCPAKIIGVTGTKGKSTTVKLIHHLLTGQLPGRVYLGGNIGSPPLKLLPKLTKKDWVILELSSFQLEDIIISPDVAVMLDVSPEHLDRHKQFKRYWEAKSNLFTRQSKQDWLIASSDYPITREALHRAAGKKFSYSIRKILPKGLYLAGDEVIYRNPKTRRRVVLCHRQQIPLPGRHNLENTLAALSAVLIVGLKPTVIVRRLSKFKGLPHRLELAGVLGKTRFIDDSAATTPVAALAAIATIPGQLAIIIGGASKREHLRELSRTLDDSRIRGIVLIGKSTQRLAKELKTAKVRTPYKAAKSLASAVELAYRYVKSEGTVLLAPAFASFDMFKDAYDRGDQFKQVVKELIKKYNKME
ncbi:UDP-N-acetylmuramoyl-L-alanine--D-glutamate ligase [Patescibacteria group bacterium]|nr:UDP-N-acetylmuramoyl-L-alanine--D-glutamate ligase [Patescibacteria group bacterium]